MIKTEVTYTCDMGDGTVAVMESENVLPKGWQVATVAVPNKSENRYLVCPNHPGATFVLTVQAAPPDPVETPVDLTPKLTGLVGL